MPFLVNCFVIFGKMFRCTIPGCTHAYSSNEDLVAHLRIYHSKSVCTEGGCNKIFHSRDGLSKHVQAAHRGFRFACECGRNWRYATNYYHHSPGCSKSTGRAIKMPHFASDLRKGKEKEGSRFDPFDPLNTSFSTVSSVSSSGRSDPFATSVGRGFLSSTSTSGYDSRSSFSSIVMKSEPTDKDSKSKNADLRLNPFAGGALSKKIAAKDAASSSIDTGTLSRALKSVDVGVQCDKYSTSTVSTQTSKLYYC